MYIGEVVGCVVASMKEERLENIPLLVVQLIEKGVKTKMIVAADATRQLFLLNLKKMMDSNTGS